MAPGRSQSGERCAMRFVFDDNKSAQAAAVLLRLANGEMYYIHLLKLLYLADRQSLLETGYPITGAKMVSMDKGPVLSEIYQSITWGDDAQTPWSEVVEDRADHKVGLRGEPGLKKLSRYELGLLERVYAKWGSWNRWDLVRYTHDLPEWHDPEGSSTPIDVREILADAGRSAREIEDIAAQVESIWMLHSMAAFAK